MEGRNMKRQTKLEIAVAVLCTLFASMIAWGFYDWMA
jgi:hypothetical protein